MKKVTLILLSVLLSACADKTPLDITRGLLGYTPPPEKTTVSEELKAEYQRCEKVNADRNCAQLAYNVVRKVKGLEPRKIPRGIVTILAGDVDDEQ